MPVILKDAFSMAFTWIVAFILIETVLKMVAH